MERSDTMPSTQDMMLNLLRRNKAAELQQFLSRHHPTAVLFSPIPSWSPPLNPLLHFYMRTALVDEYFPIHFSCWENQLELIKVMAKADPNVLKLTSSGEHVSPFLLASAAGNVRVLEFLYEMDAQSLHMKDLGNHTALHYACTEYNISTVEWLIQKGIKLDDQNKNGWTALHVACMGDADSTIKLLKEKGCDINVKDKDGNTALLTACEFGCAVAVDCLFSLECLRDVTNNRGDTAFHCVSHPMPIDPKLINNCKENVVTTLMKHNFQANIRNHKGKLPHECMAGGDLRQVMRTYQQQQRFAVLYAGGCEYPDQLKFCLVGEEMAGKTTLSIAMGGSGDPTKRTAGIDVILATRKELGGAMLVLDVAGHKEFHQTHSLFMSGESAIFALVIDARKSAEEIRSIAKYFLSFVLSARRPSEGGVLPYMLTIGTHGDPEETKKNKQIQLRDVMKQVSKEFDKYFTFVRVEDAGDEYKVLPPFLTVFGPSSDSSAIVLDARDKNSVEMKKLLNFIGKVRSMALKSLPKVPTICKKVHDEIFVNLRRNKKFVEKEEFCRLVTRKFSELEGEAFKVLMEHFDERGEIVDLDDRLVSDMPWLCYFVIGATLPDKNSLDFHVKLQTDDDGTATIAQIEKTLEQFSESKGVQFNEDVMLAIRALCHLGLSLEHPSRKDKKGDPLYIFPCHIKKSMPASAWQQDGAKPVHVGRRVQCKYSHHLITPGSYPVIQCEASKSEYMSVIDLWDGGMKVQQRLRDVMRNHLPAEALVQITNKKRAIQSMDVIARGPRYSEGDCMMLVESVLDLMMKVFDKKSPGTVLETRYLSHASISQYMEAIVSYSEEAVKTAKRDKEKVVTHEKGEDRLIDLVAVDSNHFIRMKRNTRLQLCNVLDWPDKEEKQPSWIEVGKALGMPLVSSMKSASVMLETWSQDLNVTEDHLVEVLKRPDINGTDALMVLGHQHYITAENSFDSPPAKRRKDDAASRDGATSSTATATNIHFCPPATQRMRTTTPTLEPPRQLAGKGDEQVVEQQIQQIEQLRMEGSSNDREIAEATQQTVAIHVDRKTEQPTAEAEAEKKCTDKEIVRVARLVSDWEELVCLLSPEFFLVGVIDNIKKAEQQPFMRARKALAKWVDYMADKALRRIMIKTMCVDMSLRAKAIEVFGANLVEHVCPQQELL